MKGVWEMLTVNWQKLVFGDRVVTPHVRTLRLLEETLELCQCERVTEEEVQKITRQVYDKPVGNPYNELGGVMICCAIYAGISGWTLEDAFWHEFTRIMDPKIMDKVRTRNLNGDKIGME